jgi:hypothetical protein
MTIGATSVLLLFFGLGAAAPPTPKLRRSEPITADFPDASLQLVFEKLGDAAGVKVLFDESFRDKQVTWRTEQETFDAALQKLFLVHKKAGREIQPNVIVVYEDQPQRHRKYEQWSPSGPVAAVRNREPIRLAFTEETRLQKVVEAIGQHARVNVIFDEGFRDRNVKARFDGETFEAALDQLLLPYNMFHQALDATSIVVAMEQPQVRRRYSLHDEAVIVEPVLGCGEAASGARSVDYGSEARFGDGLELDFLTGFAGEGGAFTPFPIYRRTETVTLSGDRQVVDRVVADTHAAPRHVRPRGYVGYRLELQRRGEGRSVRVEIKPLPDASWKRMCRTCTPEGQAKIDRYPAPFELGHGGSFSIDLMTESGSGKRVVDQVKVSLPPASAPEKPSRRFKVEWSMAREVDHLKAGVCIRDLATGEPLGGISGTHVMPWSDTVVVSEEGRTKDGKPMSVVARIAPADDRRTVVYGVEIWEAGELTHAEETRLPLVLF